MKKLKNNKQNTITKPTGLKWKDKGPPPACLWKETDEAKGLFTIFESFQLCSNICASLQFSVLLKEVKKCTRFLYKDIHYRAACTFSNLNSIKSTHHKSGLSTGCKSGLKGFRNTFTCNHLTISFLISHTTSWNKNSDKKFYFCW